MISVFGGGVFLATCLLDLLPDAKESLKKIEKMRQINYSYPVMEIFVAIGFLLVLSTEQVVFYPSSKASIRQLFLLHFVLNCKALKCLKIKSILIFLVKLHVRLYF